MNISLSTQPLKRANQSGRSEFLKELAYQLGLQEQQIELIEFCQARLSQLNITLDIVPLNGISFSAADAYTMNSSLAMHKVYIDPKLVGDYKLLSFIWFEPPPPSTGKFLLLHVFTTLFMKLINFLFYASSWFSFMVMLFSRMWLIYVLKHLGLLKTSSSWFSFMVILNSSYCFDYLECLHRKRF